MPVTQKYMASCFRGVGYGRLNQLYFLLKDNTLIGCYLIGWGTYLKPAATI